MIELRVYTPGFDYQANAVDKTARFESLARQINQEGVRPVGCRSTLMIGCPQGMPPEIKKKLKVGFYDAMTRVIERYDVLFPENAISYLSGQRQFLAVKSSEFGRDKRGERVEGELERVSDFLRLIRKQAISRHAREDLSSQQGLVKVALLAATAGMNLFGREEKSEPYERNIETYAEAVALSSSDIRADVISPREDFTELERIFREHVQELAQRYGFKVPSWIPRAQLMFSKRAVA